MAHLSVEARAAAAAHEAVAAEIRDFKGCHLAGGLPELGAEQNQGPRQLKRGPCGDGEEECVICRYRTKIDREDA